MNLNYCFQVWLTFNYWYMLNFNIHTIFIQLVKDLPLILTRRIAEHLYFRIFARYIHLLLTFFLFFLPTRVLETGVIFRNDKFYGAAITLLLQLVLSLTLSFTLFCQSTLHKAYIKISKIRSKK